MCVTRLFGRIALLYRLFVLHTVSSDSIVLSERRAPRD